MAEAAQPIAEPVKKSKIPLILGVVLLLVGGAGGFYATYAGLLDSLLGGDHATPSAETHGAVAPGPDAHGAGGDITFVPLEPITINLGPRGQSRHLRFSAQLEVAPNHAAEVQRLMPRIMDVLNIYLRALDPNELEEPAALLRLRGQMLRRVQIVTGPGFITDLLVMEFVFN
ncbi:MAG: flagellar basal body-associated FliL family protein [Rhodobacter sp.]|nr:flagellar basal body-associated FliL family protein [Paracoccaceae bacterium]MCC0075884.1 flagellar basal body-associated FliL family protein [Rhodobacter sp.]